MKNKLVKKISAVLALCLILCAALSITAIADDTAVANTDNAKNSEKVFDFEGATLGSVTAANKGSTLYVSGSATNVAFEIVNDAEHGNVFQWKKTGSAYATADGCRFVNNPSSSDVNTAIITFKMNISGLTSNPVRLMASAGDTQTFRFDAYRDGTTVTIGGHDVTELIKEEDNGWFEVQMIYYHGDVAPTTSNKDTTTNFKVTLFVNGTYVGERTAHSFLNRSHKASAVNAFAIAAIASTKGTVLFDDIKVEHKKVATPEIMAANVSYESELYLYYAVPKSSITTGETPKLLGTDANGSFEVTTYSEATVNGVDCYIFKTRGVPAKEIATEETVCIKAGDAMSESKTYSVQQYLYEKLYDEGYVLEAEAENPDRGVNDGKDTTRAKLYFKLLEYGSLAQALLVENPAEVIASVPYVSINGTATEVSGEYAAGTTFTLEAPADGNVSYYNVVTTDAFGSSIVTTQAQIGETITIETFTLVYPVYAE